MTRQLNKIILTLACLLFGTSISAHALLYEFNTVITGATPSGPTPWLTAEFTNAQKTINNVVTDGVLLQLRAPNLATIPQNEFVTRWYFNNVLEETIENLKFSTALSGTALAKKNFYPVDVNDLTAGGGARFDVYFEFQTSKTSGRFEKGDLADIFMYGVDGLNAETFNALSTSNNNNKKYFAEAHIQGISSGEGSSWVTPGPTPPPVPEPGTMVLLGAGLLGLAFYGKRRQNSR